MSIAGVELVAVECVGWDNRMGYFGKGLGHFEKFKVC